MINLDLYRVFNSVAECGSLTAAAKELYISQPAVSLAVKQLENSLGTTLFIRTHRGMKLTASGSLLYKDVNAALALLDGAEREISKLSATVSGTVRIGATDAIFSHILAEKIALFHDKYPEVRLELISSTSPDTVAKLKNGECDLAFVNLPISDFEVQLCGTIAHISDAFVAGKKYESLKGAEISLKDLQDYPLLMIEENTVARRELALFCERVGVNLMPDIEVANWDFMKELITLGMGVGCIPREYCQKELSCGDMFELTIKPALPVRGVGIAVAADFKPTGGVRAFMGLFGGL